MDNDSTKRLQELKSSLRISDIHSFEEVISKELELETSVKFRDKEHLDRIIKEWNDIIHHYDDPQDIYFFLMKWISNRFIFGHELIDGNKRMSLLFTRRLTTFFEYEDIQ